jgi:hypothetical protein
MSTAGWWIVSEAAVAQRKIKYVVAVHLGVTRGLFEIRKGSWVKAGKRRSWVATPVLSGGVYDEVVGPHGHRCADRQRGAQNSIAYWPKTAGQA